MLLLFGVHPGRFTGGAYLKREKDVFGDGVVLHIFFNQKVNEASLTEEDDNDIIRKVVFIRINKFVVKEKKVQYDNKG